MKYILMLLATCLNISILAQESDKADVVNLRVEGRGDYDLMVVDGHKANEECGIRGKYLNVILKGEFADKFSYSYRQRMNKFSKDMHFFDATDWLYLSFRPIKNLTLTAGKEVVAIGGYEYDRAPIDLYFCSEFWNNIPCYAWGLSVSYDFRKGKDQLLAQVCQSPFDAHKNDLYAYNLMWYGHHGWWHTMWGINAIQTTPDRYISYVTLGNEFRLGKKWNLQIDLMNRAGRHQQWIFGDYSIMGEMSYRPNLHLNIFIKGSFDSNNTHNHADQTVMSGTKLTRTGAGVEYLPLKGRWHDCVRLHADYCYTWGHNGNLNGVLADNQHLLNVGLTCRVDVFHHKKKL